LKSAHEDTGMIQQELVTVVIPAYNAGKYIAETIGSVLSQSYRNIEIIVVDDGSSDRTAEIARSYASDPRLSVFTQKNAGVSAARNFGLSLAKGKYIAFLDADDVWLPDNIQHKAAMLEADEGIGLVHSDLAIIDDSSKLTGETMHGEEGDILEGLLEWRGCQVPGPSSILTRTDLIKKLGGFDTALSNSADQDLFIRLSSVARVRRIKKVLLYYRKHPANMHRNIALMEKDELLVYSKAKESSLFKSGAFRRKCFSNMYIILAGSWWVDANNKPRALYYMLRALITYPPNISKLVKKLFK
jgi:glycosyltransferase involved in cell wall biosynthesis